MNEHVGLEGTQCTHDKQVRLLVLLLKGPSLCLYNGGSSLLLPTHKFDSVESSHHYWSLVLDLLLPHENAELGTG